MNRHIFYLLIFFFLFIHPAHSAVIHVVTNDTVASNSSLFTIQIGFLNQVVEDEVLAEFDGRAEFSWDKSGHVLSMNDFYLTSEPVYASFQILLWTLEVQLEQIVFTPVSWPDVEVDPGDGSFDTTLSLRTHAMLTAYLGPDPVLENQPVVVTSDMIDISGTLTDVGDQDGNGWHEYEMTFFGPIFLSTVLQDVPILGYTTVSIEGDLELGFSGEEAATKKPDMIPTLLLLLN